MKILIIGNSGSGKTTLANQISHESGLDVIEMDDIFWTQDGYNQKREMEEVKEIVKSIRRKESWIVEGVFGDMAKEFVDVADKLIFLNPSWEKCLSNLTKRGPDFDKFPSKEEAEKGFEDLVIWASKYYEKEGRCSFSFHKNIFDEFPREKEEVL